jgi:hypothetical protein
VWNTPSAARSTSDATLAAASAEARTRINGHRVTMILENRLGYVVYGNELQVVAEPFSDTQTGK